METHIDHCFEFCLRETAGWWPEKKVSRGEFSLLGRDNNGCLLMAMYEYRIKIMYVMVQERKLISGVTEKDGVWQTDLGSSTESFPVLTAGKAEYRVETLAAGNSRTRQTWSLF